MAATLFMLFNVRWKLMFCWQYWQFSRGLYHVGKRADKLSLQKNTWDWGRVRKATCTTFGFVLSEWTTSDTSYLPKLQEGNVFTGICLVVILSMAGLSCDHYPWCVGIWYLPPHPLPLDIRHGILTIDIWSSLLETYSNLFTWGPTHTSTDI